MYKLSNNIINVCGIMNKIKGYENILDTSLTRAKELINNRGNNEIINEGQRLDIINPSDKLLEDINNNIYKLNEDYEKKIILNK